MAQIFHRSTNTFSKLSIFGSLFLIAGLAYGVTLINRSGYVTRAGVAREQPIPFSHRHHVNELGIDCRYCHTSVETAGYAGIPPTQTCMNCHAQIWSDSATLEPVRSSFRSGESIRWVKVHDTWSGASTATATPNARFGRRRTFSTWSGRLPTRKAWGASWWRNTRSGSSS
jgi:hypothetical protein